MAGLDSLGSRATRSPSSMCVASRSLSGGSPNTRSANNSAAIPPSPTMITGPNTGSFFAPIISSTPPEAAHIGCTLTASTVAFGFVRATLTRISAYARRT